jgi:hypothetical protein
MERIAEFKGPALFSCTLPDGRRCVYFGGVHRFPVDDKAGFKAFTDMAVAGSEALQASGTYEPLARPELTVCWDFDSGDAILMWRVLCVEIVTH